MKTKLFAIILSLLLFFFIPKIKAQNEGFIYGKITTFDKQEYEGPIRWGKEELYWIDVFNASKEENENLKYLTKDQKENLENRNCCDREFRRIRIGNYSISRSYSNRDGNYTYNYEPYSNWNGSFTHQFSCQFGELKSIRPKRNERAEIELQSGIKVDVSGSGYNDLGSDIHILDKEIGEIELKWNRIEKIEFKSTPAKLASRFGEPLFGTVETFQGPFKGNIQWDKEERISVDKLDGEMEDGNVSVAFGNIKTIEKFQNRSQVTLKSGRELEMRGSNDVNSENRGIVVTQESGLMVDIPWSEFKRVTFSETQPGVLKKYEDFKNQKAISASVTTEKGKTINGKTIFDLDEEYDFELFQGRDGDIEYATAMRNVKKINVKNKNEVEVTLKNNDKLNLRGTQDVGAQNQGILVFKDKNEPEYLPWESISEIKLD